MSSLVVFPFKYENPEILVRNAHLAAGHPSVGEVLGIGFEEEKCFRNLVAEASKIQQATGTPVTAVLQERIGQKRPGKGDAINTGLRYLLDNSDHDRIHFYDADIVSFSEEWITKAEEAADADYQVVRHYFHRASTDGMVTWMITRCGFALLWPRSALPWIEQPLGGELLLDRRAAEKLADDARVQRASDWGIDTVVTFAAVDHGLSLFEVFAPAGKLHKLYGKLSDLKTMLGECFAAIQDMRGEAVPEVILHTVEYPDRVPHQVVEKIGYDIEGTMRRLREEWTPRQEELLGVFPDTVHSGMLETQTFPAFGFMDERNWRETYWVLLEHFTLGDDDWEELLFKLWTVQVLHYTAHAVVRGYDYAHRYLHAMVRRFHQSALSNPTEHESAAPTELLSAERSDSGSLGLAPGSD